MTVVDDVDASAWMSSALRPLGSSVGALVPPLFEKYARVLHPAYVSGPDGEDQPISWHEIAALKQRVVHPLVQFPHLVGTARFENGPPEKDCWEIAPAQGTLPRPLASRLTSILARRTSTPDQCWFGVWDGFGDSLVRDLTPTRLRIPGRDLVLLAGPVSAIDTSLGRVDYQSANLWWPDDRAWCVATDIDLVSTYIGGTEEVIADVVTCPEFEAFPADVDDPIGYDADRLNPAP